MRRRHDNPHAPPLETVLPPAAAALLDMRYELASVYAAAYRGTRAELSAAGLAPEDGVFPGDSGANVASRTVVLRCGRQAKVCVSSRASSPITYRVLVYREPSDPLPEPADQPEDLVFSEMTECGVEFAQFTSPSYVKWTAESMLEMGANSCLRAMGSKKLHPDAAVYDRETITRVEQAFEHARQVLQASEPRVPKAVADRVRRAEAAQADPTFRRFLRTVMAPKPSTKGGRTRS